MEPTPPSALTKEMVEPELPRISVSEGVYSNEHWRKGKKNEEGFKASGFRLKEYHSLAQK